MPDQVPDVVSNDSVVLPRFVFSAAVAAGADAQVLARAARLPGWLFTVGAGRAPSQYAMRLWELAEWMLGDPQIAFTAGQGHQRGDLSLFDYLFSTSPTLRDGLAAQGEFLHLVTGNSRWSVVSETDEHVTYAYEHSVRAHRGVELGAQFGLAVFCARVRQATRRPVVPVSAGFAQRPPRSHQVFVEAFGTSRVEFDQAVNTLTFRCTDLDLPFPDADPVLGGILRRYAATLAPAEPSTWYGYFTALLDETLVEMPTLEMLSRRLAMSPRSLQRHLAERGTTWRAELDHARRRRAEKTRSAAQPTLSDLAPQLGYSDARAVSRALHRLKIVPADAPAHRG